VYRGETSTLTSITASIIQGPASYIINASDLDVLTPGNELCKFVDDAYLIILATYVESCSAEFDHVELWHSGTTLKLNWKKSTEIICVDTRRKHVVAASPPMPGISCVTPLKVHGVTVTNDLSASDHVRGVVTNCSQTLYTLRVLWTHGTSDWVLIFRNLLVGCHCQVTLCVQCLVGLHQCERPAVSQRLLVAQYSLRLPTNSSSSTS